MIRGALFLVVSCAASAAAHPLGNFTTNRQARVEIAPEAVRVRYVVDFAEIPAFRALAAMDGNGDGGADANERAAWLTTFAPDVARKLRIAVDGRPIALVPGANDLTVLPGTGGLPTLRAELAFQGPLASARGTFVVRDDNFPGLPGWQEILALGTAGVTVATSDAATDDPTDGLRRYPTDGLAVPPAMREAHITYAPGVAGPSHTAPAEALPTAKRFSDRLTALLADRRPLSASIVAGALLLATMLGAFHALTPGHGKTIVGAYLVGSRGTWQHAVFLGLVVTVTHTLGVYALGLVTLVASAWILPERLLPWLSAASGLLVVAVGAGLLRERLATAVHGHVHHHADDHEHHHAHGHLHAHPHGPPPDTAPTLRNLLAIGISGGLVPCPSALVVMLGAIAVGRTAFGLGLIAAFSVGLAMVLTGIGLVLVHARDLFERLPLDGRVARFLPVASAAIISLAGLALVVEALARIGA